MIRFLICKPVAVIMVFVALVLLGIMSALHIPVSPLPDINVPEITVHVTKNNTSARDLESTVIKSLRTQLQQVPSLDNIHSETRDGYSVIKLRFKYGSDIDYAFIEVNEKIDLSMNGYPRDMERPRAVKTSATDIPVFYINMRLRDSSESTENVSKFIELSDFSNQVIKRRLEQLPEIAFADISGVSYPEIYIIPDKEAVSSLNLSDDDFKQIIENNNLLFGNVSAMDGVLQYNIRFAATNPISVEDIRNISFKLHERIFKLKDIAKVGVRQQDARGVFMSHNQDAINLAVIKQPDAKLADLRTAVVTIINQLKKDYPNIVFEQTQDQTALLEFSINNLKQDLLIGGFLAFVLMFFFLKNLRSPLLIGITIPVCLMLSILFFYGIHLTINIISLSGLVLGLGLMIDNSIIVIDNISQQCENGAELLDACENGTTEIIRPLIASAFTTCSVFLPLIFLSGISGALFYDQAMAITIGLISSLLVSVTLLPTLYFLFHKSQAKIIEHDFFEKYGISFFEQLYESGFHWVFKHKIAALLIVIGLMVTNVLLFTYIKKEKLPAIEESELIVRIDWNRNITIAENKKRVREFNNAVTRGVVQSNAMIGQQQYLLNKDKELSSSETQIYLKIKDPKAMPALKDRINTLIHKNYPEAALSMKPPESVFEQVFGESESDLVVMITQNSDAGLPSAQKVREIKELVTRHFADARVGEIPVQQTITINADPEKLLFYNISTDVLYNKLKSTLNASVIGNLHNGLEQIPIVMNNQSRYLEDLLSSVTVTNNNGIVIPVAGFLKISKENSYKTIEGDRTGNYVSLNIETRRPAEIIKYINSNASRSDGVRISYSGSYFSNISLVKEMAIVLLVAVLLLYFILAAQFESIIQPLIVLLELPISMCGALMMLYFFNSSINLISLIGLVVMCGVIINDSILKIDTVNQLRRKQGFGLMDAIHTAGLKRLKSIIMTAATTILSVMPFMFGSDLGSSLQRPLSLALIGGMLLGTPVSLYFIPLVYWFYYRKSDMDQKTAH